MRSNSARFWVIRLACSASFGARVPGSRGTPATRHSTTRCRSRCLRGRGRGLTAPARRWCCRRSAARDWTRWPPPRRGGGACPPRVPGRGLPATSCRRRARRRTGRSTPRAGDWRRPTAHRSTGRRRVRRLRTQRGSASARRTGLGAWITLLVASAHGSSGEYREAATSRRAPRRAAGVSRDSAGRRAAPRGRAARSAVRRVHAGDRFATGCRPRRTA